MELTDDVVAALPAAGKDYSRSAAVPGLQLRVSPKGAKSWSVFVYDPKKRRVALGRWPDVSADEAAALAKSYRSPANGNGANPTLAAFVRERYLPDYADRHKRASTAAEDRRILEKDVLPAIGEKRLTAINRADVQAVYDALADGGRQSMATKAHAVLSRVLTFAAQLELIPRNPAQHMNLANPTRRTRCLDQAELVALLTALAAEPDPHKRGALELMVATGQRPGEVIGLEWREVSLADRLWRMPASKAKNGRAHRVPLTEAAVAILARSALAQGHASASDAAGSPAAGRVFPISDDQSRRALGQAVERAGIAPCWRHDLRRTVATIVAWLGYNRDVRCALLNHDRWEDGIYNRHDYQPEVRRALEAMADFVGESLAHAGGGEQATAREPQTVWTPDATGSTGL